MYIVKLLIGIISGSNFSCMAAFNTESSLGSDFFITTGS